MEKVTDFLSQIEWQSDFESWIHQKPREEINWYVDSKQQKKSLSKSAVKHIQTRRTNKTNEPPQSPNSATSLIPSYSILIVFVYKWV